MKYIIAVLLFSLTVPASALVCGNGCEVYKDVCACDIPSQVALPVQPSDEKPPKTGMPSWQAADAHIVDAPNMMFQDEQQDRERINADADGRQAAGIPVK